MIEIKARMLHRSVFIPEETIVCEVIVTNKKEKNHPPSIKQLSHQRHSSDTRVIAPDSWNKAVAMHAKISDDEPLSLAYGSAQIYCQCNLNDRKLKLPPTLQKVDHATKHSFSPSQGEKGYCLLTTEAVVLFCDLKLRPGESKIFSYSQTLPYDIPPSYKGQNVKLSYKVCIGIGRIGRPLTMIRLPFRVFELKGIFKALKQRAKEREKEQVDAPLHNLPKNPFLCEQEQLEYSKLDVAMDALTAFTVKRNLNTYNIHSVNGAVGKFCLSKHYYRIGEDILGTFDFQNAPIACIKYVVSIQVEETISKNCLILPSQNNLVHYTTLSRHEECCYLATKTNFLIPIPVTATPEFSHKIVSVRWRLHFEFTIVKCANIGPSQDTKNSSVEKEYLNIPSTLKTELMLWDLPIHVVATNPIQASLMMQAGSSELVLL